ncbi:MAG TPA: hypothetical protein VFW40_10910 [Capsulimonadaceae bacterium]|nr:hypothetical protein [Capsulimonadaceae bacterium]
MPPLVFVAIFVLGKAGVPHITSAFALSMTAISAVIAALTIPFVIWAVLKEARETSYSVTTQRALIRVPTMNSCVEYEVNLTSQPRMRLEEYGEGIGTIIFGERPNERRFRLIPDARKVYDLLQGNEVTGTVETSCSTLPQSWLSNPLEEHLHHSEEFLWLGKPQKLTYVISYNLNILKVVSFIMVPFFLFFAIVHQLAVVWPIFAFSFGIVLLVAPLTGRYADQLYYGVTNKRVLIRQFRPAYPNSFIAIPLIQLQSKLTLTTGGYGSIEFEAPDENITIKNRPTGPKSTPDFSFRGIPNAQLVYNQIEEAKRRLTAV